MHFLFLQKMFPAYPSSNIKSSLLINLKTFNSHHRLTWDLAPQARRKTISIGDKGNRQKESQTNPDRNFRGLEICRSCRVEKYHTNTINRYQAAALTYSAYRNNTVINDQMTVETQEKWKFFFLNYYTGQNLMWPSTKLEWLYNVTCRF